MAGALALHGDRFAVMRGLMAGIAWGLAMSAGLSALVFWQCGVVPCPDDIAITTALSVTVGLVAIGPLAALHRPAAR